MKPIASRYRPIVAFKTVAGILAGTVLLLGGLFLFPGCEETLSGTDVELPYREELVVQGLLTADSTDNSILITRTLPPLEEYSSEKAAVTDAVGSVTADGREYPLVHIASGLYNIDGLRPESGRSYRLNVEWKNLHVEATATVPPPTELVRVFVDTVPDGCGYFSTPDGRGENLDMYRTRVEYVPHGSDLNSVSVSRSYFVEGTGTYRRDNYYLRHFFDIDSSGTTNIASVDEECWFEQDGPDGRLDTLFLDLIEMEAAYTPYYESSLNRDDDNIFATPGGSRPVWNVSGDGFGWFFGRSRTNDTIAFR